MRQILNNYPIFDLENMRSFYRDVEILEILAKEKTYIKKMVAETDVNETTLRQTIYKFGSWGLIKRTGIGKIRYIELTEEGKDLLVFIKRQQEKR